MIDRVPGDDRMKLSSLACTIAVSLVTAASAAANTDRQRYVIPKTGAAVEIPTTIFNEDAGLLESGWVGAFILATAEQLSRSNLFQMIWYDRCNRSGNYMNCVIRQQKNDNGTGLLHGSAIR
jgi:hypothetical protein